MKTATTSALVLVVPNFSLPFELKCDARGTRIGAILMQREKLIVFANRMISGCAQGLCIYEKELTVIVVAVCKWHSYLLGSRFTIKTDHSSLKYFFEQWFSMTASGK